MIVSESFSLHFKSSNEIISSWGFKPFLSAVELMYTLDTTKFLFSFKKKEIPNPTLLPSRLLEKALACSKSK